MSYADMPTRSNGTQKTLWLALLALVVIVASLRWFGGDAGSAPGIGKGGGATARLLVLNGTASVTRADGVLVPEVTAGQTVALDAGDEARTGPGSSLRLSFGSGSSLDLAENSRLTMLALRGGLLSRAPVIELALLEGSATVSLEDLPLRTGEMTLETSAITVHSRGSRLTCDVLGADQARVTVHAGAATVSMGEQSLRLEAGQLLEARLGQALSPITVATPQGESTATPQGGVPGFLDESNRTLFPPVVTPTRPGDPAPSATQSLSANKTGVYVVQPGDTLYSIARRFGVSWEDLWAANRAALPSPELLQVGQSLSIPQ